MSSTRQTLHHFGWEIDHIKPVSLGGKDKNGQPTTSPMEK